MEFIRRVEVEFVDWRPRYDYEVFITLCHDVALTKIICKQ